MVLSPDEFTDAARETLHESQQIVQRYRHIQWDSEYVLMALLERQEGVVADVLREIGADAQGMRRRLHDALDRLPKTDGKAAQIYQTPRVSRLLYAAKAESERLQDAYISAEHLLIALTQDAQDPAARFLSEFGVTQEAVYQALQKARGAHRVDDPRAESR